MGPHPLDPIQSPTRAGIAGWPCQRVQLAASNLDFDHAADEQTHRGTT